MLLPDFQQNWIPQLNDEGFIFLILFIVDYLHLDDLPAEGEKIRSFGISSLDRGDYSVCKSSTPSCCKQTLGHFCCTDKLTAFLFTPWTCLKKKTHKQEQDSQPQQIIITNLLSVKAEAQVSVPNETVDRCLRHWLTKMHGTEV